LGQAPATRKSGTPEARVARSCDVPTEPSEMAASSGAAHA